MNAELKGLHSPDIPNLESFQPEIPTSFAFLLQVMVGPAGEEGMESFDVTVCTPGWLETNFAHDEVVMGRHYLIVQNYNYSRIVGFIKKYLSHCSGTDWEQVAAKVSRLGYWEFEDYSP